MTHLWVRAEQRPNEERVGLTPEGAADLIAAGIRVTVEESHVRAIPIEGYKRRQVARSRGRKQLAPGPGWTRSYSASRNCPKMARPLPHRHIMFGHAYKGQHSGRALLERFKAGGGTLYDLEYLVDTSRPPRGRLWLLGRICWALQSRSRLGPRSNGVEQCPPVGVYASKDALNAELLAELDAHRGSNAQRAIVIGASGPCGHRRCRSVRSHGCRAVTKWDMAETASGGPFPEILDHDLFLNCIFRAPRHAGLCTA